jgi:hypothetical protein
MKKIALAVCALALIVPTMAGADEATRWVNVDVTEASSNTKVEVHLPLNLVLRVIEGIKVENFDAGKVKLEATGAEIDWPEIMAAIKDAPDGKFVTVTSDDADVDVKKEAGMVLVHVTEKSEEQAVVDVRLPISMVDALSIDEQNQIDVTAILASLAELPGGELVKVTSKDANVRVWVD